MGILDLALDDSRDMLPQKEKVVVVGAGVMGLTSAIKLREAGYDAEIWTKDSPLNTTSTVASFWEPFASVPDPKGRDDQWGKDTYDTLMQECKQGIQGLDIIPGMSVFPSSEANPPSWSKYVSSYQDLDIEGMRDFANQHGIQLPAYVRSGYRVDYPTFDMPLYLNYLMARYMMAGGQIHQRTIEDMSEPLQQSSIVINCTGAAARELVGDTSVQALRGQLVKVTRPVVVDALYIDDESPEGMINIMLHRHHIMLGGTAERSTDLTPLAEVSAAILKRCIAAMPALAQATKISDHVGLRPARTKGIRVEAENTGILTDDSADDSTASVREKFVVHNYGHGGSGVTFSWGCANEVLRIVEKAVKSKR